MKVASTPPPPPPPVGKGSSINETQVTKTINSTLTSPATTVVTVAATDPNTVVYKNALQAKSNSRGVGIVKVVEITNRSSSKTLSYKPSISVAISNNRWN